MKELPDFNKNPRELREELGRKITALIHDEINRVGREQIEPAINALIDDYSLGIDFHIELKFNAIIEPMTGEDFVWPELEPPSISFDGK